MKFGGPLNAAARGPNVRANNHAGDLTNEAEHYAYVTATGRFVVVAWLYTKGLDAPAGTPPSTQVGYAYSCDWGATFTDGGSVPRAAANDQVYGPALASDGR